MKFIKLLLTALVVFNNLDSGYLKIISKCGGDAEISILQCSTHYRSKPCDILWYESATGKYEKTDKLIIPGTKLKGSYNGDTFGTNWPKLHIGYYTNNNFHPEKDHDVLMIYVKCLDKSISQLLAENIATVIIGWNSEKKELDLNLIEKS